MANPFLSPDKPSPRIDDFLRRKCPLLVRSGRKAIDPNRVLPAGRTYYGYERSLTTPPWSETVDRFVLAPGAVSANWAVK